jgi:hypothetical protein
VGVTAHVIGQAILCDRTIVTNNALIGRQTILGGKSLVTCDAIIMITGQLDNAVFSGNQHVTNRGGSLNIATLPWRQHATA